MLHSAVVPTLPASGVTHSVVGRFSYGLPDDVSELVLFKMNNVEVWRVPKAVESEDGIGSGRALTFVSSTQLNAPPVSVAICRPPGFAIDVIAMCFDDFHVSLVRYDAVFMRFHTLALVQLDDRDVSHNETPLAPLLRADPTGRFLAVLARRRHLFLLPLLGSAGAGAAGADGSGGDTETDAACEAKPSHDEEWGDEDEYAEAEAEAKASEAKQQRQMEQEDHELVGTTKGIDADERSAAMAVLRVGHVTEFTLATAVKGSVRYVRDVQFIESHGEPIIAVLCERQPTWAGRVKLVQWRTKSVETNMLSCSVAWLQIAAAAAAEPKLLLIGEVDDVPYNVTHMVPVGALQHIPSGVVCFGLNTVMHVTTKRGYGVYLNDSGRDECANSKSAAVSFGRAAWADAELERSTAIFRVNLNFAGCAAAALRSGGVGGEGDALHVIAVTENDGVVATLQFVAEGHAVQGIRVSLLGVGCHCSAVTPLGGRAFFLGSARGGSCVAVAAVHAGRAGRLRVVAQMHEMGSIADVDVVDCTAGSGHAAGGVGGVGVGVGVGGVGIGIEGKHWFDTTPYAELLRGTTLDPSPAATAMQSPMEVRAAMDLAVATGCCGGGALFVCRQSVRHRIGRRERVNAVSAFLLEPFVSTAAAGGAEGGDRGMEREPAAPSHLLLTGVSFTILFVVRGELVQQMHRSEFAARCRTVFAAVAPWIGAMLQVTEREGRIISHDGRRLLHRFPFITAVERDVENKCHAKAAALATDFQRLFVLLGNGTLLQFTIQEPQSAPRREVFAEGVTAFALWPGQRRIVTVNTNGTMEIRDVETRASCATFMELSVLPQNCVGGVGHNGQADAVAAAAPSLDVPIIAHLEVTTFPYNPVEVTGNAQALNHSDSGCDNGGGSGGVRTSHQDSMSASGVRGGLTEAATALIVILSTGEMAVYQVLGPDTFGPLRLIKSFQHFLDNKAEREVIETIESKKRRLQQERTDIANDTQLMRHCSRRVVVFDDIGGNSGAYVCGQNPVFLFWDILTERLVAYRHQAFGPVRGFVPLRSRLMEKDRFVLCYEGFVDFAAIDTYCRPGGNGWLTRRVHLGVTPHFIVYHPPAYSCFVITSHNEPFRPQKAPFDVQLKIHYNEEENSVQGVTAEAPVCNIPPVAPNSGIRVPMAERFDIRFMSTGTWKCTDTLLLEENEQVLGAQMVEIHREKSVDGPTTAPVCVVSTAFPLGEDVTCRGRILILASKWVKDGWKILCLHSEPLNGPATAVTGIRNHVAVAVGGTIKLFRYDWESRKLVVGALLYAGVYVTRMSAFRNYIIYGDLYRSCAFARFEEDNHTLTVLGKDCNAISIVECGMMYHDRAFGILASDDQRNVIVMGYTPRVQESEGRPAKVLESILSLDGEYRMPSGCLAKSLRFRSLSGNSSVTLYVTNYGEIGFIVPIGEQANRTALWVARRLQTDLQHAAGLTPRMFLGFSQASPRTALRAKEMLLSVPLLKEFFLLDVPTRKAIANAAYTQLDRVTNIAALVYEECNLF